MCEAPERVRGGTARRQEQHQHHRHGYPPAEEAHRVRRPARIAPPAGTAQPLGVLRSHRRRAAAEFARKNRHLQRSCALRAAPPASLGGELRVNLGEKGKKRRIVQNADVRRSKVSGGVTGDSPEGLLHIQSPDGDPAPAIRAITGARPSCASCRIFNPACDRSDGTKTTERSREEMTERAVNINDGPRGPVHHRA